MCRPPVSVRELRMACEQVLPSSLCGNWVHMRADAVDSPVLSAIVRVFFREEETWVFGLFL